MWNPLRVFFEHDYRWNELDKTLTDAFEKVKAERSLVFSWLNYFRKKDNENEKLQQKVQYALGKHDAEIDAIKNEIKGLKEAVKSAKISPFPDQIRTKSGLESGLVSGPKFQGGFVNRIVAMVRPQRKEFVMQKILDMVEKGAYTTKQVETVIVREKGLCGRTAFYDYMKELKYQNLVRTAQKKGRKILISE
ncbi:hypothetical protein J4470_00265 [Candidatus Woesearchaeota archaeon]|nr:hypothetical protein [Candidatus Woesearchaeota archaeon]